MAYTDPVVDPKGRTRDEHLAACMGCRDLAEAWTEPEKALTCYEYAARAQYAVQQLAYAFYYDHGTDNGGIPGNLPGMADAVAGHLGRGTVRFDG